MSYLSGLNRQHDFATFGWGYLPGHSQKALCQQKVTTEQNREWYF